MDEENNCVRLGCDTSQTNCSVSGDLCTPADPNNPMSGCVCEKGYVSQNVFGNGCRPKVCADLPSDQCNN